MLPPRPVRRAVSLASTVVLWAAFALLLMGMAALYLIDRYPWLLPTVVLTVAGIASVRAAVKARHSALPSRDR